MKLLAYSILLLFLLGTVAASPAAAAILRGKVVDAATHAPLEGAFVTLKDTVVASAADGSFTIEGEPGTVGVRAYGHLRVEVPAAALLRGQPEIALQPFKPKALYLSVYGIGSSALRRQALNLIEATELNATVIDLKSERGMIAYPSSVPLAAQVGAQSLITVKNLAAEVRQLHERGVYTIARIVVFSDDRLARTRPELAVRCPGGRIYSDRLHLAWTDPFVPQVQKYNIGIAVEAAKAGFDEVQLDYVRFPDMPGLVYAEPNTRANRVHAIDSFLKDVRGALVPYNVFLAVDIFGYVSWNLNDTAIGQQLEDLPGIVDYISPMLYPSGFQFGIPGYHDPVQHPYEIVYRSLERARQRTGVSPVRFRPWLQAFRDYAFDRRPFGAKEIKEQITAAEKFGADGWMLWNPRNVYSENGLSLNKDPGCQ
ncbi:MAG TPA: putative glycoside hydrolase [Candidatus Binataceae bacterium]|nr:putative glycoside hydrolase [Candidatus Binataceae bacterium]